MVHSQRKGGVAERAVAKMLRDWTGLNIRRSGLGKKGHDLEVVGDEQFPWAVEVKDHASVSTRHLFTVTQLLIDFWAQAVRQAAMVNKMPLLVIKVDRTWYTAESILLAKTHDCQTYLKNRFGEHTVIIRPLDNFMYDYDQEK